MERRLAAILVADVVGYSRLLRADEAGTLAALQATRKDILEPLIGKHRGRLVKLMGDGALVEFASAVAAVQCAVELQEAMEAANEGLAEDRRLMLRIGLDLGDVVVVDGDLYGDGVNVAARLEALADPGTIILSQAVLDQVRSKIACEFEDLGEQRLKNVPEPVPGASRFYAPQGPVTAVPRAGRTAARQSLRSLVLPFTNMSGDPEQEYFSDGITEDIITDLSQISAISVVARNTAFNFKGKTVEIDKLARQLQVGYVLRGSVRKAGNRIRITAQLVDAATGGHLWAKRFDRVFADIFALQDEISRNVVDALKLKLLPEELKAIRTRSTSNAQAYKLYLQARARLTVSWGTRQYLRSARRLFTKAVKADPGYARAYAGIADCDAFLWVNGDLAVSYDDMLTNSSKALALAPHLAEAHASRGVALYAAGHSEQAIVAFERAIGLDSGLFEAHYFYGCSCRETGDFPNAALHFERAAGAPTPQIFPAPHPAVGYLCGAGAAGAERRRSPRGPQPHRGGVWAGARGCGSAGDRRRDARLSRRFCAGRGMGGARHARRPRILHGALQRGLRLRRCRQTGSRPGMPRIRLLPCAPGARLAAGNRQARHAIEPATRPSGFSGPAEAS